MKSRQVWFFVFGALVVGLILGYLLGGANGFEVVDLPLQRSCKYNGQGYKNGEGFMAIDGCNSCSCKDGQVECTLMGCEVEGL